MSGRIGILGGTFDPPHIGHLVVAQDALESLELDRLIVVPAGRPPHREALLDAATRLALVRLAFEGDEPSNMLKGEWAATDRLSRFGIGGESCRSAAQQPAAGGRVAGILGYEGGRSVSRGERAEPVLVGR